MNLEFLLRGWVLGLLIAAPVGPIGVLCIRRTLAEGRLYGFVSGLGAATADATYGAVAAFGLTFAGLGVANTGGNYLAATLVVLGVFLGSATWWFTLSGGISLIRSRFGPTAMQWVNRISGAVITLFGLVALISIFVNK